MDEKIQEKIIVDSLDEATKEKILTPKNDYIFKRIFGTKGKEEIVKSLLEAILDIKIKTLELDEATDLIPSGISEKFGKLDVKVVLEDGTKIDIEMQNANTTNMIKRAHFYVSKLYSEIKAGTMYTNLRKSITIFITNFNMFNNIKEYHTIWRMTEQEQKSVYMEEMELHFIELPKFMKTEYNKKDRLSQWLIFLDYSNKEMIKEIMKENEKVKEANEELEKLKADRHAQYWAWKREEYEMEIREAREKGESIRSIEIAKKLKKMGLTSEQISEATDIEISEIEKL